MADSVELAVNLKDGVSKSAKSAASSIEKLARQSAALDRKMASVTLRAAQARQRVEKQGFDSFISGTKGSATALGALVAVSVGVAAALGGALVESARKAGQLEYSLARLTHGDGGQALRNVSGLAVDLGLNVLDTAHAFEKMLKLQFTQKEATTWIKFGADMQALGNSAEDVQGILLAIGQIKSKGKLQGEEMLQLAERGVSGDLVKGEIAKLMGVQKDAVEGLQRAGKISADVGLQAIQGALLQKLQEKQAGEAASVYVQTFAGGLNKGESFMQRVGLGLGSAFNRGFSEQSKQTQAFNSVLPDDKKLGMSAFFDKLANDPLIERLGAFVERLGAAFEILLPQVLEVARAFTEGFSDGFGIDETGVDAASLAVILRDDVAPAVKTVGTVLGYLISAGLAIGTTFTVLGSVMINAFTGTLEFFRSLPGMFYEFGANVVTGFVNGITGAWEGLKDKVSFAADTIERARSVLGIRSPSKEFAYLGQMSSEGFQQGLSSTTPELPGASAMVGGAGAAAGSSVVLNLGGMVINVGGDQDPDAIGAAVFAQFEAQATRLFGQFAGAA